MRTIFNAIKWDFYLIYKYGIIAVAAGLTILYSVAFLLNNTKGYEHVVAVLIFMDPVMYGFLFAAVMVLFEKDAQTHQVIAVTPMPTSNYIISKTITFTLLSLICSFLIILSAQPQLFHYLIFTLAVVLSASLFVFIAIIGVSFVQNFNQFILVIPLVLAPVCLPLLHYFNLYNSLIFYLIPSQACLILFKASVSTFATWEVLYAVIYLFVWNAAMYYWALKTYKKRILKTE